VGDRRKALHEASEFHVTGPAVSYVMGSKGSNWGSLLASVLQVFRPSFELI